MSNWAGAGNLRDWAPGPAEPESVWADWGHEQGWVGASKALADLGCWVENCKQPRMLFACMRPEEAAQVLGERQPAQEQDKASS